MISQNLSVDILINRKPNLKMLRPKFFPYMIHMCKIRNRRHFSPHFVLTRLLQVNLVTMVSVVAMKIVVIATSVVMVIHQAYGIHGNLVVVDVRHIGSVVVVVAILSNFFVELQTSLLDFIDFIDGDTRYEIA